VCPEAGWTSRVPRNGGRRVIRQALAAFEGRGLAAPEPRGNGVGVGPEAEAAIAGGFFEEPESGIAGGVFAVPPGEPLFEEGVGEVFARGEDDLGDGALVAVAGMFDDGDGFVEGERAGEVFGFAAEGLGEFGAINSVEADHDRGPPTEDLESVAVFDPDDFSGPFGGRGADGQQADGEDYLV
jgi:hypothetical protein